MKAWHHEALGNRQARGLWGLLGTPSAFSVQGRGAKMPVVGDAHTVMHAFVILSKTSLCFLVGKLLGPLWVSMLAYSFSEM